MTKTNKLTTILILITSIIFISLSSISFVSANGLNIINNPTFNVNKTIGVNEIITFEIKNEEPFTFYNISFEDNPRISMPIISQLNSGETINVSATIFGDEDFVGGIKIRGFYQANLGASNESYEVEVDYYDGLSLCDLSIIKGDSITWRWVGNGEVKMKNTDTNVDITPISEGGNYTSKFNTPGVLNYAFFWMGFMFTDVCTINTLDDTGIINNPELDESLSINLKVNYEPTTIQTNVLERKYSIGFLDSPEGVITLTNTGSNIAKKVKLEGDWFNFNKNEFDIAVGGTTIVIYNLREIKPGIYDTNHTNKTYIKNISISGNFGTINEEFEVFLNFAEIDDNYNPGNGSGGLRDIFDQYCIENPEICDPEPRIIYRNIGNNSDNEFNVSFGQEQVKSIFAYLYTLGGNLNTALNVFKSDKDSWNVYANDTNVRVGRLEQMYLEDRVDKEGNVNWIFFGITTSLLTIIIVLVVIFLLRLIKKKRIKKRDILNSED